MLLSVPSAQIVAPGNQEGNRGMLGVCHAFLLSINASYGGCSVQELARPNERLITKELLSQFSLLASLSSRIPLRPTELYSRIAT
jgi:hypothetical protein